MSVISEIYAIAIKQEMKRQNLTEDFLYLLVQKPDTILQSSPRSPEADHMLLFSTHAQYESYAPASECNYYRQKMVCLFTFLWRDGSNRSHVLGILFS